MQRGHLKIVRHRMDITGRVHGVGFRYHVLKLAEQMRLNGFVKNTSAGVTIEVEGDADDLAAFVRSIEGNPPRYARIDTLIVSNASLCGERGFRIATEG